MKRKLKVLGTAFDLQYTPKKGYVNLSGKGAVTAMDPFAVFPPDGKIFLAKSASTHNKFFYLWQALMHLVSHQLSIGLKSADKKILGFIIPTLLVDNREILIEMLGEVRWSECIIKLGSIDLDVAVVEPDELTKRAKQYKEDNPDIGDDFDGKNYLGLLIHRHNKILLSEDQSLEVTYQTLWHEIIHAIDCLFSLGLSEKAVDNVSHCVVQLLTDNEQVRGIEELCGSSST